MTVTTYRREALQITPATILLSLLGLLTFLGVAAGVVRLILGMGATTALSDAYPWGIWIGFDFTLIAFSGSAFTMATVVYVLGREEYRPVMVPAVLAGMLGYVAVLLILVLDLGRWDRFYHFIIFWNVHSPLFEVCWCILLYSTVLLIENSPHIFDRFHMARPSELIHRFVLPISVLGLTLSSLHQSTLGTMYLNMPHRLNALWYSPIVSPLFFVSSVMAGLSLAMIAYTAAARLKDEEASPRLMRGLARALAWVSLLYVVLKLGDIALAGELPALLAFDMPSLLMWIELGLGAILPMIVFFIPALRAQRNWQLTGALLLMFGVMMNRLNATWFAQLGPGDVTYSPHILEWLSTFGIVAGAAVAWYLGMRYLIPQDEPAAAGSH